MSKVVETTDKKKEIKTSAVELFEDGTRCYIMWFRVGNRPPMQKRFLLAGDIDKAIERAKFHCSTMDYRFCGCYPDIVDLDKQEARRQDELGLTEF